MKRTRVVVLLMAALAPSAWVAWKGRDMPHLGLFHDDSLYWVCAKSLANGSGYRILSLPEQPHQTKYPPLYPLLLAGIWKINPDFPDNLAIATLLSWLWLPLCLLACQPVLAGLGLGRTHRLVVTVLLALNPYVILYSVSLMSEVPFTCFLLGCLALAQRAEQPGASRWLPAAAGLAGGVAFLMRTVALPLVATTPLLYLVHRRAKAAALFFAAMLPAVAAWTWWVRGHALDTSDSVLLYYTSYLGYHLASFTWQDLPLLLERNTLWILEGAGGVLTVFDAGVPAALMGVAALLGVVRLARRCRIGHYLLFSGAYLLLLLGWQLGVSYRSIRLVLPLAPLLVAGFTFELRWWGGRALQWYRGGAAGRLLAACGVVTAASLCVLLGAAHTLAMLAGFPGFLAGQRATRDGGLAAYRWVRENAPKDAVFLTGEDAVLYLHTGRCGYRFLVPPRLLYRGRREEIAAFYREVGAYARRRGVTFVLTAGEPGRQQVGDAVGEFSAAASSADLELARRWPLAAIYRVKVGAVEESGRVGGVGKHENTRTGLRPPVRMRGGAVVARVVPQVVRDRRASLTP